jgi:hypothetical protein
MDRLSKELYGLFERYDLPEFRTGESPRSQIGFGVFYFESPAGPEE